MPYTCSDDPSHSSSTADVCSVCGALIGNVPPPPPPRPSAGPPAAPSGLGSTNPTSAAVAHGPAGTCSNCGVPRTADMLFCENCGFDFTTGTLDPADAAPVAPPPSAPAPAAPVATATPAAASSAPATPPDFSAQPTNVLKAGPPATLDVLVTVDLGPRERPDDAHPPADQTQRIFLLDSDRLLIGRGSGSVHPHIVLKDDSGISRGHAELIRESDGSFAVRDLDSANGTSVNGKELSGQELVPLKVGDQIQIGFWHTLTVRQR